MQLIRTNRQNGESVTLKSYWHLNTMAFENAGGFVEEVSGQIAVHLYVFEKPLPIQASFETIARVQPHNCQRLQSTSQGEGGNYQHVVWLITPN